MRPSVSCFEGHQLLSRLALLFGQKLTLVVKGGVTRLEWDKALSDAMQCGAIWCDLVRFGAMRCDAMRCDAMRCDAMRCDAMRCDAMR